MEKTWYLFPGQTLENTKIKDRGKALIATKSAMKRITDHLDRKRVQQELIDEEINHNKFLKNESYNLTKDWDNTIEKMQERRLLEHDLKIKSREENLYKRFMELRQEQAEERRQIAEECRKKIVMINRDSRDVNSSLLLTEVLHERNLQIEFDRSIQNIHQEEDIQYAELVRYNANREKLENADKKKMIRERNIKHSQEIQQQIKEKQEVLKKETEQRLKDEMLDHEYAHKELKAIQQYEYLEDKKRKDDMKQQFHEFKIKQKEREEEARKQSECEDKIVQICARGKCRIEHIKKTREKEAYEEKCKNVDKMANLLFVQNSNNEAEFNRILNEAVQEKEKNDEIIRQKKEAYQKRLRDDRIEYRNQCLKREEEEKKIKKEIAKWDMANRFKADEILQMQEHLKDQQIYDEKIQHRYELDKQIQENKDKLEYEKKCAEQELLYHKNKYAHGDQEFFEYSQEVLDLAKTRGRTTKHIEKAIHKYKVDNNLLPKKKSMPHLNSKVPINDKK